VAESLEELKRHIGESDTEFDVVSASVIAKLAATLGVDTPAAQKGDPIPPGWHTGFFPPTHRPDNMRPDGQAAGGGIMPKVPLPRRRLAGETFRYLNTLAIGDEIERLTEIADITIDEESGGPPVSMIIRHTIASARGPAVIEERHFIYLSESVSGAALETPPLPDAAPAWRQEVVPDLVLLFRYSAIRFNSHRIHYDREYVTEIEGCPGLIVQGSLISQLMQEMCRANMPDATLIGFSFRTLKPLYDTGPFVICGAPDEGGGSAALWLLDSDGALAVTATADFGG
jgi:3-methylfumaryl-CoA hydratase